jgi:phospholipid/cholesterol/gamma-HCH transport system permease protein
MRVSEEVDALITLGLDPYRFLVLPRVLALLVVAPLLTFLAAVRHPRRTPGGAAHTRRDRE